jgi:hypothetical protein
MAASTALVCNAEKSGHGSEEEEEEEEESCHLVDDSLSRCEDGHGMSAPTSGTFGALLACPLPASFLLPFGL